MRAESEHTRRKKKHCIQMDAKPTRELVSVATAGAADTHIGSSVSKAKKPTSQNGPGAACQVGKDVQNTRSNEMSSSIATYEMASSDRCTQGSDALSHTQQQRAVEVLQQLEMLWQICMGV